MIDINCDLLLLLAPALVAQQFAAGRKSADKLRWEMRTQ